MQKPLRKTTLLKEYIELENTLYFLSSLINEAQKTSLIKEGEIDHVFSFGGKKRYGFKKYPSLCLTSLFTETFPNYTNYLKSAMEPLRNFMRNVSENF